MSDGYFGFDPKKFTLVSPIFTGAPTSPTPPQFNNTERLATTAFVQRALGNKAGYVSYSGPSVTLSAADAGKDIYLSFAGAVSVTLPNATTIPAGATFSIVCSSDTTASVTIAGAGTFAVPMGAGGLSYTVGAAIQVEFSSIDSNIYLVKNGAGAASLFSNGYQRLPSGLIIQWGTATVSGSSGAANVTFPIAFPTACLSALANSTADNGTTSVVFLSSTALIINGMDHTSGNINAPAGTVYLWVAIGY